MLLHAVLTNSLPTLSAPVHDVVDLVVRSLSFVACCVFGPDQGQLHLFCNTAGVRCRYESLYVMHKVRITYKFTCWTLTAGHSAAVLDGRKISKQWQADLTARAADVATRLGRAPGLGVVLVGDRADSRIYVQRKQEAGTKVLQIANAAQAPC